MKGTMLASYATFTTAMASAATVSSPEVGMLMLAAGLGSAASAVISFRRERKHFYEKINDIPEAEINNFTKQKHGDMAMAIFLSVVLGMGLGFFGAHAFLNVDPSSKSWVLKILSYSPNFTAFIFSTIAARLVEWFIDDGFLKFIPHRKGS